MSDRYCPDCKQTKPVDEFYKNKVMPSGLSAQCKECTKLRNRTHYQQNSQYREAVLELKKKNYKDDPSLKDRITARNLQRYHDVVKNNPRMKLDWNISTEIRHSLKGNKSGRKWESLVGYNVNELMTHLENLFLPGMTWENHGLWHIDHVKPKSKFQYTGPDDPAFRECWALDNLQPLWAEDNLRKSDTYNE